MARKKDDEGPRYMVVKDGDASALAASVAAALADGWQLAGGVAVSSEVCGDSREVWSRTTYYQAMVKP